MNDGAYVNICICINEATSVHNGLWVLAIAYIDHLLYIVRREMDKTRKARQYTNCHHIANPGHPATVLARFDALRYTSSRLSTLFV